MIIREKDILYFFVMPKAREYVLIYNETADGWIFIKAPENIKLRPNVSGQFSLYSIYKIFLNNTVVMVKDGFQSENFRGPFILDTEPLPQEIQDILFNKLKRLDSEFMELFYIELDENSNGVFFVEKIQTHKTMSFNTKLGICVYKALERALKGYKPNGGNNQ